MNVLDIIRKNRGQQHAMVLQKHSQEVAQIESGGDFKAIQKQRKDNKPTGPGRGLYQYEVSENTLGGVAGSGAAATALTRYYNFYNKYKQEIPKQYKEELNLLNKDNPDFSKLSKELQQEIFYADKERSPLPLDDLASGKLSLKDAYVDYHWIGNKKSKDYESEKERVNSLYGDKIKTPDESTMQETGMTTMEDVNKQTMLDVKRIVSKQVALDFNILNTMEDLGQTFVAHDKEVS